MPLFFLCLYVGFIRRYYVWVHNIPCNRSKHTICLGQMNDVIGVNRSSILEKEKRKDRNLPALLMLCKLALDKFCLFAQLLMHSSSGFSSVAHSKNNGSTTTNNITTGINGRNRRLHVLIYCNRAFASHF